MKTYFFIIILVLGGITFSFSQQWTGFLKVAPTYHIVENYDPAQFDYSSGISLSVSGGIEYAFANRFSVQSGLIWEQRKHRVDHLIPRPPNSQFTEYSVFDFQWIQLPLIISYYPIKKDKFQLSVKAGYIIGRLTRTYSEYKLFNGETVTYDGHGCFYLRWPSYVWLGMTVEKQFLSKPKIRFLAEPYVKYRILDGSDWSCEPVGNYSFGCNLGVAFDFTKKVK